MNKYDQLMYFIINRILIKFGMRVIADKRIIYAYHIRDYTNPKLNSSIHIITLSKDVSKAFDFLKMDYEDYKEQQFKTIFDFTSWVTDNCKYLTVDIVKSIEEEISSIPENERTEIHNNLYRFCATVKIGHIVLRDFKYSPLQMYDNLRERIIRNFFTEDEVQNQFINIKFQFLKDVEIQGKFCPRYVVSWIPTLRSKPTLTGIFTNSFVNYITQNTPQKFPKYMVDTDVNIIKKEVINYYENLFQLTEAYTSYSINPPEKERVVK